MTDMTFTQLGEVLGHWGEGVIKRMCFSITKNQRWETEMNAAPSDLEIGRAVQLQGGL